MIDRGAYAAEHRLAAYGTLAPGRPNHHQVSALEGRWLRGHVRAEPAALLHHPAFDAAPQLEELASELLAPTGLTATRTTFSQPDLICALAQAHAQGAPAQRLLARAETIAALPSVRLVEAGDESAVRRGSPATSCCRWSRRPCASRLSTEQRQLVCRAATSADSVVCVIGHAGAGKTTELRALREAAATSGALRLICSGPRVASAPDEFAVANRAFAVGDRVVCRHDSDRLDVRNGLRATVIAIAPDSSSVVLIGDRGQGRALPASYLEAGHLDHAYASGATSRAAGPASRRASTSQTPTPAPSSLISGARPTPPRSAWQRCSEDRLLNPLLPMPAPSWTETPQASSAYRARGQQTRSESLAASARPRAETPAAG